MGPPHRTRQFTLPQLLVPALTIAVMLTGVELVLRSGAIAPRLPRSTIYYRDNVDPRQRLLERLQARGRPIDVLFIGSSIVRTNINPRIFDATCGGELLSFNAGLDGLHPGAIGLYLEHFWLPRCRPAVVVCGVRYGSLVADRAPAEDPILMDHGLVEPKWTSPRAYDRTLGALMSRLRLLHYPGILGKGLEDLDRYRTVALLFGATWNDTDERGFTPTSETLVEARAADELPVLRAYWGTFEAARLQQGLSSLRRMHELCEERGVRFVVVAIPEHADRWSAPGGAELRRQFVKYLGETAEREGYLFIDGLAADPELVTNDHNYRDYHHMSSQGAERFTRTLGATCTSLGMAGDRGRGGHPP